MASSANSPQKRVLVVDDSKFVRTTFAAILKRSFGVREEADGEAAWHALETDSSLVMVFTDLEMPQLDGFSLLARIRGSEDARIKALPVVVISGHDEAENKQRAKELGANDFIAKTADAPEVLSRLDNVLRLVRAESSATHDPLTGALTPHYLLIEGRKHYAHARRHGLGATQVAEHLLVQLLAEQLVGNPRQLRRPCLVARRRRAIDQDVNAPKRRQRLLDHPLDRGLIRSIGADCHDPPA